jgi:hypothetical protein
VLPLSPLQLAVGSGGETVRALSATSLYQSAHRSLAAVTLCLENRRFGTEVEVTLRPTGSRPVSLGVKPPPGTRDQFFFFLEIFFRQFRVCYFVAPSLTRGLLLLVLASGGTLGLQSLMRGQVCLLSADSAPITIPSQFNPPQSYSYIYLWFI